MSDAKRGVSRAPVDWNPGEVIRGAATRGAEAAFETAGEKVHADVDSALPPWRGVGAQREIGWLADPRNAEFSGDFDHRV